MTNSPQHQLIACPDCQKQISARAVLCPHCGCPVQRIRLQEQSTRIGRVGLSAVRWALKRSFWPFFFAGVATLSLFLAGLHDLIYYGSAPAFSHVGLLESTKAALYAEFLQDFIQSQKMQPRPDEIDAAWHPNDAEFKALMHGVDTDFWEIFRYAQSEPHALRLRELALEEQATWRTISGCWHYRGDLSCSRDQGVLSLSIAYFIKLTLFLLPLAYVLRRVFGELRSGPRAAASGGEVPSNEEGTAASESKSNS